MDATIKTWWNTGVPTSMPRCVPNKITPRPVQCVSDLFFLESTRQSTVTSRASGWCIVVATPWTIETMNVCLLYAMIAGFPNLQGRNRHPRGNEPVPGNAGWLYNCFQVNDNLRMVVSSLIEVCFLLVVEFMDLFYIIKGWLNILVQYYMY